ncbi:hypothetical protein GF420_11375 [candidate division GN15 bacterium]|nr:hypothetical protein [candidate division GN15 bacterium]
MSVDSIAYVKHFGSLYTMEDYTTTSHNVFVNANYVASEKVNLFGTVGFTKATAELDEIVMPAVTTEIENSLSHQDFTFEEAHTYSDLDYTILRFTLGGEYTIAPNVVWTADFDYADLTDDQPWVYGDESGSYFVVRSGVRFDF